MMKSFLTIIVDKNEIVLNVCSRARPEIVPVWSLAIAFRLGGVAGWRREAGGQREANESESEGNFARASTFLSLASWRQRLDVACSQSF